MKLILKMLPFPGLQANRTRPISFAPELHLMISHTMAAKHSGRWIFELCIPEAFIPEGLKGKCGYWQRVPCLACRHDDFTYILREVWA